MKKQLTIALLLLCGFGLANAQLRLESSPLSTEVYYTPSSGTSAAGSLSMPDYGVKLKMALNDLLTLRMNVGMTSESSKDKTFHTDLNSEEYHAFNKSINNEFSFAPGIECHFVDYEFVSPYVGLEAGFAVGSKTNKTWNTLNDDHSLSKNPTYAFRIGALAGVDVYLCEGLYAGLEFGLGYQSHTTGRGKNTVSVGGTETTSKGNTVVQDDAFGFYMVPAVRLGWHF